MSGKGYIRIDRKIDEWEYLNKPLAFCLWMHLLRMAAWKETDELEPGQILTSAAELSRVTGMYRETITQWLKEFERAGQISVEKLGMQSKITLLHYGLYNKGSAEKTADICGKNRTSEKIHAEKTADICGKNRTSEKIHAEKTADICGKNRTSTDPLSLYYENNETLNDIKHLNNIGESERKNSDDDLIENRFREFWQKYPRKKAKKSAEKAFRKACKTDQDFDAIMDGLERSADRWRDKQTDPQFIPYPATWLNGGQWEDEEDTAMDPHEKDWSVFDKWRVKN